MSVDLPLNNAVFQRDTNKVAKININGTYTAGVATSVQARLKEPISDNVVSGFDWQVIDSGPTKGYFMGTLVDVPTGWYKLEVRLMKNGTVLSTANVNRVGVGDVFFAWGQSNAGGFNGEGNGVTGVGAVQENVVSHDYFKECASEFPPIPVITKIEDTTNLGINGYNGWYYGPLGDALVTNIETDYAPVAFFNGASGGKLITNFTESLYGGPTINPWTGVQECLNFNGGTVIGNPSLSFFKTIKYYGGMFGMRSIYWHQGESDTYFGTDPTDYQNKLAYLISNVRTILGANIPWIVSRASRYGASLNAGIIAAQTAAINPSNQVFYGPHTDDIHNMGSQIVRDQDDVHFLPNGLQLVADRIKDTLTAPIYPGAKSFYDVSKPIIPKAYPDAESVINGSNVTLTLPSTFGSYKWVAGNNYDVPALSTTNSYTGNSGVVRCYVTDANGNISLTQAYDLTSIKNQQVISTVYQTAKYLSDYTPYQITANLGPVAMDKAVGGTLENDGGNMVINGSNFSKGISMHSGSSMEFVMNTGFHTVLRANIGIDDAVSSGAAAIFKVYGDGNLLYTSPVMTHTSNALFINVNIVGRKVIKIAVENSGGSDANNQADWGNLQINYDKPFNLNMANLGSKCGVLNWTAANINAGIASFNIYLNNNLLGNVPASVTSYLYSNLSPSTLYSFGVQSVDTLGNLTSVVNYNATTLAAPMLVYPAVSNICTASPFLPSAFSPAGGVFSLQTGAAIATINASTGEINFSALGSATVKYLVNNGAGCKDSVLVTLVADKTKPNAPMITSSTVLVNKDSLVTLNAGSSCANGILWSNNTTTNMISVYPTDTTSYYAVCDDGNNCQSASSNIITVNVIPDCISSANYVSPTNDLSYPGQVLSFKVSTGMMAANKIFTNNKINYKAGQSIELKPGFEVKSGGIFSAKIAGCP